IKTIFLGNKMRYRFIIIPVTIALNISFMGVSIADKLKNREFFSADGEIRARVGIGHLVAQANEYLYEGDRMVSRLIRDIKSAQTIEAGGELDLSDRWVIYGSGTAAMHRRGFMTDYDYVEPGA